MRAFLFGRPVTYRFGCAYFDISRSSSSLQAFEFVFQLCEFLVGKFLKIDQFIPRTFHCPDQLVEFQMNRLCIPVLGVLNNKDHQERYDRGAGINDELPGVGEMEERPGRAPDCNDKKSNRKRPSRAQYRRRALGKKTKRVPDNTKQVSLGRLLMAPLVVALVHNFQLFIAEKPELARIK